MSYCGRLKRVYRCSRDLMATRTSSTDMRPTGPDAYMEPKTTPPRERRSSVGCM